MNLDSIYKKAKSRISNPTVEDIMALSFRRDIDAISSVCVHNKRGFTKKAYSFDTQSLKDIASRPGVQAGAAALAGALLAGGGATLMSEKRDDETDQEHARRRNNEALAAAVAGGAIGGATPYVAPVITDALSSSTQPSGNALTGTLGHLGNSALLGTIAAPVVMAVDNIRHSRAQKELFDRVEAVKKTNPHGSTPTKAEIAAARKAGKPVPKATPANPLNQKILEGLQKTQMRNTEILSGLSGWGRQALPSGGVESLKQLAGRHIAGRLRNPLIAAGVIAGYPILSSLFKKVVDPQL